MRTILSTCPETEMINSCKNNCLFTFSLHFPSRGCFSERVSVHLQFSSHTETLVLVAVYFLRPCPVQLDGPRSYPRSRISVCVWMCVRVCVCVCPVRQTRSALMLYFKFPEGFIERAFPGRLDVCLRVRSSCFSFFQCAFQYRVRSQQIENEGDASRHRKRLKWGRKS